MEAIALAHRPHAACLVPERREEVTTEGGLDVGRRPQHHRPRGPRLADAGIRVSAFIDADLAQVAPRSPSAPRWSSCTPAPTARPCASAAPGRALLRNLKAAAAEAARLGLEVHAGHGIDYETVKPVAAIPELVELNIGHFLIGEAIFIGLGPAIQRMRAPDG